MVAAEAHCEDVAAWSSASPIPVPRAPRCYIDLTRLGNYQEIRHLLLQHMRVGEAKTLPGKIDTVQLSHRVINLLAHPSRL